MYFAYIIKTAIICGDGCQKLHHPSIVVFVYVYLKSRFNLTFQTIRIGCQSSLYGSSKLKLT